MLPRTVSEKASGFPVMGRRRRWGAWLLVGWVAFWFTTVAQACCIGITADSEFVGSTPAFHAGAPANDASDPPALPDINCDALSAIGPAATAAAAPAFWSLDQPTVASLASERAATDDYDRSMPASGPWHPPASGVPLYLRNQRLLI